MQELEKIKEMADFIANEYYHGEKEVSYNILDNCIQFIKTIHPEEKVVYIKQDNFGRVKIGVSCNSENRNKQLSDTSGLWIEDIYDSEFCTNWGRIESDMHKIFESKRIKGEWFDINPQEAIEELKEQTFKHDSIIKYLHKIDFNKVERLYKIIKSGHFYGLELDVDDQFIMECSEEELKNKIYDEMKDIGTNFQEKQSKLNTFETIEDELYYYVKIYFYIYETDKIIFDSFTIEKSNNYDPYAYFNDESYGDRLHLFSIGFGETI